MTILQIILLTILRYIKEVEFLHFNHQWSNERIHQLVKVMTYNG